jgi:CHAD domain-containing protein
MGRNRKWIDGQPDDSVRRIARRALGARLERVWHFLERAVRQPQSETEDVHQLRVFSRRAAAALSIFEDWLPPRRGRWVGKQVKRLRKAAGDARDLDVLLMRWMDAVGEMPSDQATLLLEHVKHRRCEAQRPIQEIYRKLVRKRFGRKRSKFLKRVWNRRDEGACGEKFACMARVALGRLAVQYLQAAGAELTDADALHAFRIQGKQVRYAMEVFAGAFDEEFRTELYPVVVTLQERLGAINDYVTARAHLATWREETDSCALRQALEIKMQQEQRLLESTRREFLNWWTPERREDLRRRFARYVSLEITDHAGSPTNDCG